MRAALLARSWGCGALLWLLASCGPSAPRRAAAQPDQRVPSATSPASCPTRAPAPRPLPHTRPEHERLDYWLKHSSEIDRVVLSTQQIAELDQTLRDDAQGKPRFVDLTRPLPREEILAEVAKSLSRFRSRFASGEYALEGAHDTSVLQLDASRDLVEERSLRVALHLLPIRCTPLFGKVRSTKDNPKFDRNSCSSVRPQEAVEVIGKLGGHWLVRSRYAVGFVPPDPSALSPPIAPHLEGALRTGAELEVTQDVRLDDGTLLPRGTVLPASDTGEALVASTRTVSSEARLARDVLRATLRPLTRREFLEEAFRYVGSPYGWGDEGGGRDCSRLVVDVMRNFGLHTPRVSDEQSEGGSYSLEVPSDASEVERLGLLDAAAARGIVLAHFPGHIMIYLGRDAEGIPRALHSFAEYLAPCPGGGETLFEVGRVSVTDLSLGKGTTRRSFLERITRLTIFGEPAGPELLSFARFRVATPPETEPAECTDSTDLAIFRSPRDPVSGSTFKIIVAATRDPRPHGIFLRAPAGQVLAPPVDVLGTGPFALVAEIRAPASGRWTAMVANGASVAACERFTVLPRPRPGGPPRAPQTPVWTDRWRWERDTEQLYAAFIEQLFSTDVSDMRSWSSLSQLLADPQRNLLFNHLGLHEDERMKLSPDCADLPYFLRGYFAWKLALPFAFSPCTRGRKGEAPRCGAFVSNDLPIDASDDVEAFSAFMRKDVGYGVHSGSARTLPTDNATDLYPVALERASLAPGAVFADPYGHTIIVAKWIPQGIHGQGLLLGADAQPDGTVGRRRFWAGNFLFTSDTKEVGAGFKAFRTLTREPRSQGLRSGKVESRALRALDNLELQGASLLRPYALDQYKADARAFYERMDSLIYPRPILLDDRIRQLVDALSEQVARRVEAIDVGEQALVGKGAIQMPSGGEIFETVGAWEDFATPSRDMRLLIAIDTIRALPFQVAREPSRFGVTAEQGTGYRESTLQKLQAELASRAFEYKRSDGSTQTLSLSDVLARDTALEVGYNPNDCPEVRWGAPVDSKEGSTCRRRAPEQQRVMMEKYRAWFRTRTRPPRD